MDIQISNNSVLEIMIENQGRINYGHMNDAKGLVNNVTIDGVILENWTVFHVDNPPNVYRELTNDETATNVIPAFFKGTVPSLPSGQAPQDTYLLLKGWTKVCVKPLSTVPSVANLACVLPPAVVDCHALVTTQHPLKLFKF